MFPTTSLNPFDGTQPVIHWHVHNNTSAIIPAALIRRFRHRLYSQVADAVVPVHFAHWYFVDSAEGVYPRAGDEIQEFKGTVWTILEANLSPLTGLWQAVCETSSFAVPTEQAEHLRPSGNVFTVLATLPVRVGDGTTIFKPVQDALPVTTEQRTFYMNGLPEILADDLLRRSDGSLWKILRVESPMYRARWTKIMTEKSF